MGRRLAAIVGLALLVAGCGGHNRSAPVVDYIDQVNAIQRSLAIPLGQVTQDYQQLSHGTRIQNDQPQLEQSVRTIGRLNRRIDALQPPSQAVRLDRILRSLVAQERQLATEVALLAGYVRDSSPIVARAAAAGTTFHTALHRAKGRKAQAAVLDGYVAPLQAAARDLAALDAPPVVKPSQVIEVRTYRAVAKRSRALAAALLRRKGGARELHALEVAVASNSSTAAQLARIAAIRSWNRRVTNVGVLQGEAQRERNRLQHALK